MILRFLRTASVAFRKIIVSTGATELSANTSPTLSSGSGAPNASEPKGSLYLRTGGASGAQVLYVATDSVGTWVAMANTAAAASLQSAGGQAYVIDAEAAATAESKVKLADNLAVAWSFYEAANLYLKIITTNASEAVHIAKDLQIGTTMTRVPGASTAAAGTTTADATVLPAGTASVYPTTAADDTRGVRLHASDKVTGRSVFIGNGVSNKILKVYPVSGGTINGAAADAAISSQSGRGVWITCLDSGANTWLAH